MKKILFILIALLLLNSCFKQKEINEEFLISKYNQKTLTLNLSSNKIDKIPNLSKFLTGSTIQEIKYINLSGNNIKDVNLLSFDKFTNLEEIDLSNNKITWINIQKINSKKINLNNNKIEKIAISGSGIVNIDLGNNLLKFGNDINLPTSIKILNLEKNKLENLDGFSKYNLIEKINLNGNKLGNKDLRNIKTYKKLKRIDLLNNKISEKKLEIISKFNLQNK